MGLLFVEGGGARLDSRPTGEPARERPRGAKVLRFTNMGEELPYQVEAVGGIARSPVCEDAQLDKAPIQNCGLHRVGLCALCCVSGSTTFTAWYIAANR